MWQTLLLLLAGPSPARQLVRLGQLLHMRLLSQVPLFIAIWHVLSVLTAAHHQ